MEKELVMFGAGENGLALLQCIEKAGGNYPKACFDNDSLKWGKTIGTINLIIQNPQSLHEYDRDDCLFVVSIGCIVRDEVVRQLESVLQHAEIINSHTYIASIAKTYYHGDIKWERNYRERIKNWLRNYKNEWEWHEKKIAGFHDVDSTVWNRESQIARLEKYKIKANDRVIDVGCGPTLKYESTINGVNVNYIPVDPLGMAYNQFAEKYNFKMPVKIGFAFGEHLVSFFGKEFADYILYDNSMDHAIDPLRCILESIRVLKKGGVLSLRHNEVEAQLNTAEGLHQWDFLMNTEGDFVIANENNYVNISKLLSPFCKVDTYEEEFIEIHQNLVIVNIEKREEVPETIIEKYDADVDNGVLIQELFALYTEK